MNNSDKYLQRMFEIVSKAGAVAKSLIDDSDPGYKKDQSIITKADKAISKMAREALEDILQDPAHILIDEEDPNVLRYLDQKTLEQTSYIWAIDPIDGTLLYANRMPLFGISLGLMKDLKPWLGVVYFPMVKELFYCDGKDAYFAQNVTPLSFPKVSAPSYRVFPKVIGHPEHKVAKIVPQLEEISGRSLFFCNDTFFDKFYWKDKDFHIMIHACAVVNLCWPAIGRGVGCFLRCHIWDFAGAWPIIQKAGFDLRRAFDGQVMDKVDAKLFSREPKPWQMKEYYLISTQGNYSAISSKIGKRPL